MSPRLKRILNYLLIFGTLAAVLLIGFSGQDLSGALQALRSIHPKWLLLCFAAMGLYYGLDAFSVWYFLRQQGYRITLRYALYVSIIGAYYSNITPGATGGQPMQVYSLKKKKVPIGIGTSALLVKFFCFQFMLAVAGAVFWIARADYIAQQLGNNQWILVTGFVYNTVMVTALVMLAVNRRIVAFLLRQIVRLLAKLHIIRDPEGAQLRVNEVLDSFHSSIMMVWKRPLTLLVQLVLGLLQLLSQMLVTWFIYKGFQLQGSGFVDIIALGIMLYTSAAYAPMPGASGAQEGIFALYFGSVFPDGIRLMALLLWRFFTFYLSLILGAAVTVAHTVRKNRKSKRRKADPVSPTENHQETEVSGDEKLQEDQDRMHHGAEPV